MNGSSISYSEAQTGPSHTVPAYKAPSKVTNVFLHYHNEREENSKVREEKRLLIVIIIIIIMYRLLSIRELDGF